jgi:Tfp pilus assembly protein PilO
MAPLVYKSSLARYSRYLEAVNSRPLWKASLYLILSLMLMIVLLVVALKPTLVTIAGLLGQIHQEQELEKQLDAKIQAVALANQKLLEISTRIAILDEALPTKAEVAAWTNAVDRVGQENQISIPSIELSSVPISATSTTSASYGFTIIAEGSYDGLQRFIQTLQNLRRLIIIQDASFGQSTETDSDHIQVIINGTLGSHL